MQVIPAGTNIQSWMQKPQGIDTFSDVDPSMKLIW